MLNTSLHVKTLLQRVVLLQIWLLWDSVLFPAPLVLSELWFMGLGIIKVHNASGSAFAVGIKADLSHSYTLQKLHNSSVGNLLIDVIHKCYMFSTLFKKFGVWGLCKFTVKTMWFLRENVYLFLLSELENNEGKITGMKVDRFCTVETHMWKWSIGHSVPLPANVGLLPTIKPQRLSPDYFKIWFSCDRMSRSSCMSPGQYTSI